MSDCRNGGRGAYDVCRLRIEFSGEAISWMYPLALNGRTIEAVFVDGRRYVPAADRDWDSEVRDDSAKKLEEDVIGRATLSYYGDGTIRLDSSYMDRASLADVFGWLDRQAAITERENDELRKLNHLLRKSEEDRTGAREVGMTNYEKYFSTPEKAAEMQIHSNMDGFEIFRIDIDTMDFPELVASIPCVADDPAALYEWMKEEAE